MHDLRDACGQAVSLPAVDAYAQSRRLQPVLRASETAAPPASVQKLRLRRVVYVLSHSPQRHREKPGIEEPHSALRLTRLTRNRSQRSDAVPNTLTPKDKTENRVRPDGMKQA
jgi:hypothetical protein